MAAGDVDVKITTNRSFKGACFDGINDRAFISAQQTFNNAGVQSVSLWFKARTQAAAQGVFAFMNTADNNRLYLTISNLGAIQFVCGEASFKTVVAAGAWDEDLWHHVVMVRDATTLTGTVYFDGTLVYDHQAVTPNPNATTATILYIGAIGAGSYFNGIISDIFIYNKELTQAEVTQLAAGVDVTDKLIMGWLLNNDYNSFCGKYNLTNDGSFLVIADDAAANVISTQRATASATGKYLITKGQRGQVVSVAITD